MHFPENLRYTKEHEWILFDGQTGIVGITDFAQSELGDIVFVDVIALNREIQKNEVFGTIEAVKTVSDLYLPVSGKILEFNESLHEHPEYINTDPYGKGWIIKIEVKNPLEFESLLSSEEYKKLIGAI